MTKLKKYIAFLLAMIFVISTPINSFAATVPEEEYEIQTIATSAPLSYDPSYENGTVYKTISYYIIENVV